MTYIGKKRGVVTEVVDFYAEFLRDHNNDATVLPYLEGDYWVNEVEEIIGKLPVDSQQRSQSLRKTAKVRDPVMAKLSKKIAPNKDTFFVVKLQSKQHASNKWVLSASISNIS